MPNFGEKLKQLRSYKGLTQDDLANIVKSSKQVISRYEKGYRSPDISIAKNWADALNIPVRYLVDDSLDLISFLQNPQISKNNLIPLEKIKKIPVLGKIACGTPILAEQNIDAVSYTHLDVYKRQVCKLRCDFFIYGQSTSYQVHIYSHAAGVNVLIDYPKHLL